MRSFPERPAPWWFVALLSLAVAAFVRGVAPASEPLTGVGANDRDVQLAFWQIFVVIAQAVWTGVQVAGKVALAILQYSVQILWRVVTLLGKAANQLGIWAWRGLKVSWKLFRATYERVLKPAWKFVWKWVDKTERWLARTFGPLLKWLRRVRSWVLDFYADYVRPILDMIGIGRRVLGVLSKFGVEWARKLDAQLARIEAAIDRPFRLLLAKINEAIGIINRVVTADGLFQRLALIRSIERDLREVNRAFVAWRSQELTDEDFAELRKRASTRTSAEVIRDATDALVSGGGRYAGVIEEMVQQGAKNLGAR